MVGVGSVKNAALTVLPFNQIVVKQTWGREIPVGSMILPNGTTVGDSELISFYRDGTLLMQGLAELLDSDYKANTYSCRLNPTLPMFRIVPALSFNAEPAQILKVLNQPVAARLLPYNKSIVDDFVNLTSILANWKVAGAWAAQNVFLGVPYPWNSNPVAYVGQYVGLSDDNHSGGVGVMCFGGPSDVNGVWLNCTNPVDNVSADSQTVLMVFKIIKSAVNRAFVALTNSQPSSGTVTGYVLEADFDGNTVKLYKCPATSSFAGWAVLQTATPVNTLVNEIGKWCILKLSRRNRGTIASPNYFWKGAIIQSDGTQTQIAEAADNTYTTWQANVGARGNGAALGQVHLHVDRANFFTTGQINTDLGVNADIPPWAITSNLSDGLSMGGDTLDECLAPYVYVSKTNALNTDKHQIDMGSTIANVCRVDVLARVLEYPISVNIDISTDNISWTNVLSLVANTSSELYAVFSPQNVRYVRAILTSGQAAKWSCWEFKIYQKSDAAFFTLGTVNNLGSPIPITYNYNTVWDAMHMLSDAVGWHLWVQPRTGTLNFASTRGTDQSATVKFQQGVNIIGPPKYQRSLLQKVDRVWVIGSGTGVNQAYATAGSTPAGYKEAVYSAKNISDVNLLQNLATALLAILGSPIETMTLEVNDTWATATWDVGDLVNVTMAQLGVNASYRVINVTRTYLGSSETCSVDLVSQAAIALQIIETILTYDNLVAQLLLSKSVRELQTYK